MAWSFRCHYVLCREIGLDWNFTTLRSQSFFKISVWRIQICEVTVYVFYFMFARHSWKLKRIFNTLIYFIVRWPFNNNLKLQSLISRFHRPIWNVSVTMRRKSLRTWKKINWSYKRRDQKALKITTASIVSVLPMRKLLYQSSFRVIIEQELEASILMFVLWSGCAFW